MKKTIYLVWATRGDYSDRIEYAVCWYTTEAAAKACVRRMRDASAEWRTRVSRSDGPYGEVWDRARAAIGDPQWSPGDDTEYQVSALDRGAS